jgi:tetratricopeptide (TPR) repeat protein
MEALTKDGDSFLAAKQYDRAISAYQQALGMLPANYTGIAAMAVENERALLKQKIASAYFGKANVAKGVETCLESLMQLQEKLNDYYKEMTDRPFTSSQYIEMLKSSVDTRLTFLDIFVLSADRSAATAKGCSDLSANAKIDDQTLLIKALSVGMLKLSISEVAADGFHTASSYRLMVATLCNGNGKNVCGPTSRKNEVDTYSSKALEQINKAIQIAPAVKKFYIQRAKTYSFLGNTQLAAADEAKAAQMK